VRNRVIAEAVAKFDSGVFERHLAELVAVRSTSQEVQHEGELRAYLGQMLTPWLERMGFICAIYDNPVPGFGPLLIAERVEAPDLPTVLSYGHGDTVRGMEEQWTNGREPWTLRREGDRWYGRGTADNKGQHLCNLFALEVVLAALDDRLGYNVKLVIEMAEERGSAGLAEFIRDHAAALSADVFLASDGPRVAPDVPTVAGGTRGNFQFDLVVSARAGGVHSGHWGGLTTDPALVLAHALASICDQNGRILVRDWLPGGGAPLDRRTREMLARCPVDDDSDAAQVEETWGESSLSAAERRYAWNSFIVRAMISGRPDAPQNAVAPNARAHCEIRYTPESDPASFAPALRRHLDARGLSNVFIEAATVRMPASATPPGSPWLAWVADSIARSTDGAVQIIPNISGGMPGQAFVEHLGLPLVWVPHSHNGCKQHGPDEHMLVDIARQAVAAFAGLWFDLGHGDVPWRSETHPGNIHP
jgi:acetylornithine deacetylase/succinyl-diaminopimelate desuccinylase-like protein